jgi:hypothetical protein
MVQEVEEEFYIKSNDRELLQEDLLLRRYQERKRVRKSINESGNLTE